MKKILIVEDDEAIRTGLCRSLSSDAWIAVGAEDLASAGRRLETEGFDLLLLDCNLPDGNGIDFCRDLMNKTALPVIFLTVRDAEMDEVAAFRAGACDYVKKPFSLMVLRERIAALLERTEKQRDLYVDRRYRFDFGALDFLVDGTRVHLGATEYKLLAVLVKNAGKVLSRAALTDALWEGGEELNENALSVTVSRLRGRLGEKSISTIYGLGYMWVGDRA
ncbi:response regulator transcription factor [Acutalibacter caecimuris]|uniref:response regulator transcription factor n=1 Tax=Acutalibacter caecimuris TaxID=3093657 RepID=UPI002AC9CB35|nr:response regulator transcription factor [Acutalibacter sp. M00118]